MADRDQNDSEVSGTRDQSRGQGGISRPSSRRERPRRNYVRGPYEAWSLYEYAHSNPIALKDISGLQPDPATLAQQIQQQANSLIQLLQSHHGLLRGTFEAAIAEAQGAQLVGSAGQTFEHIRSLEQGTASLIQRERALTQSLQTLSRLDPRAAGELSRAFQPATQRARQMIGIGERTRELITEIHRISRTGASQLSTRLSGVPLQTSRTTSGLVSTQLNNMRMNLVPQALADSFRQTLASIRQLPATLGELGARGRGIAASVSSSLAALRHPGAVRAAGSAIVRFFGAAAEILGAIGSRLITLPLFIIIVDENGNPIGMYGTSLEPT